MRVENHIGPSPTPKITKVVHDEFHPLSIYYAEYKQCGEVYRKTVYSFYSFRLELYELGIIEYDYQSGCIRRFQKVVDLPASLEVGVSHRGIVHCKAVLNNMDSKYRTLTENDISSLKKDVAIQNIKIWATDLEKVTEDHSVFHIIYKSSWDSFDSLHKASLVVNKLDNDHLHQTVSKGPYCRVQIVDIPYEVFADKIKEHTRYHNRIGISIEIWNMLLYFFDFLYRVN